MKVPHTLMTTLLLLAWQNANARIGATPNQAQARYGIHKTSTIGTDGIGIREYPAKNGTLITAHFQDGKIVRMVYQRPDRNIEKFSPAEIQKLWNINTGSEIWDKQETLDRGANDGLGPSGLLSYSSDSYIMYEEDYGRKITVQIKNIRRTPPLTPDRTLPGF